LECHRRSLCFIIGTAPFVFRPALFLDDTAESSAASSPCCGAVDGRCGAARGEFLEGDLLIGDFLDGDLPTFEFFLDEDLLDSPVKLCSASMKSR
jgi:hypothetical protein